MNKTIAVIQKLSRLKKDKILKSLEKLYNELNYPIEHVPSDWRNNYLTLTNDNVLWYLDQNKEAAITIESCKLLNNKELAMLLCDYVCDVELDELLSDFVNVESEEND